MGSITIKDADDLPYGPGNPDYEYDGWRERMDDDADGDPYEELLIKEAELKNQRQP